MFEVMFLSLLWDQFKFSNSPIPNVGAFVRLRTDHFRPRSAAAEGGGGFRASISCRELLLNEIGLNQYQAQKALSELAHDCQQSGTLSS